MSLRFMDSLELLVACGALDLATYKSITKTGVFYSSMPHLALVLVLVLFIHRLAFSLALQSNLLRWWRCWIS
jgi:hypothetical protein